MLFFSISEKKNQWVQLLVLTRTVCTEVLSIIENRKKIRNFNKKFAFKIQIQNLHSKFKLKIEFQSTS